MKVLYATALAAAVAVTPVAAGAQQRDRAVNTALGAGAGALVGGPVGLVAGGAIGYFAGKDISRAMGLEKRRVRRNRVRRNRDPWH